MQLHAQAQAIHTQDSACSAQNTAFGCIAVRVLRAPRRSAGLELWCVAKATTIVPCLAAPSPRPIGRANRICEICAARQRPVSQRGLTRRPCASTRSIAVRTCTFSGVSAAAPPDSYSGLYCPLTQYAICHASVASGGGAHLIVAFDRRRDRGGCATARCRSAGNAASPRSVGGGPRAHVIHNIKLEARAVEHGVAGEDILVQRHLTAAPVGSSRCGSCGFAAGLTRRVLVLTSADGCESSAETASQRGAPQVRAG